MSVRTATRYLKMIAEVKHGSLTIFSPTLDIEQVSYNSFLVKFTLKSG